MTAVQTTPTQAPDRAFADASPRTGIPLWRLTLVELRKLADTASEAATVPQAPFVTV